MLRLLAAECPTRRGGRFRCNTFGDASYNGEGAGPTAPGSGCMQPSNEGGNMCDCDEKSLYEGAEAQRFQQLLEDVAYGKQRELYRCAPCGSFWEKTYPYPELQGDGPPVLSRVSKEYVTREWRVAFYDSPELIHLSLTEAKAAGGDADREDHTDGIGVSAPRGFYVRAMPWDFIKRSNKPGFRLAPGEKACITAADDVRDLSSVSGVAERLALVDSTGELSMRADGLLIFRLSADVSPVRAAPLFQGKYTGASPSLVWQIPSETKLEVILSIRMRPSELRQEVAHPCCKGRPRYEGNEAYIFERGLKTLIAAANTWLVLYKCVDCGSLWEEAFPIGEMQGGGPPSLTRVTREYVRRSWGIRFH